MIITWTTTLRILVYVYYGSIVNNPSKNNCNSGSDLEQSAEKLLSTSFTRAKPRPYLYSETCVRKPPLRLTLMVDVERWLSYKGTCHVILLAKLHDMYLYKTATFPHQPSLFKVYLRGGSLTRVSLYTWIVLVRNDRISTVSYSTYHYKNMPIQIYWKFYHQKKKKKKKKRKSDKNSNIFIFLLKT